MPTFVLSDAAEADIAGIIDYIAGRNLAAAVKMLDWIENACQILAENPELVRAGRGSEFLVAGHIR